VPTLSKLLQPIAATCPAETPAATALAELIALGADALVVVRNGAPIGLFSHREALAMFGDGAGPVEHFMRRPLPGRNLADSMESGADIMVREDTPALLLSEDEGSLFKKTSRTVGMVSAYDILAEIGKTTTDTASNKVLFRTERPRAQCAGLAVSARLPDPPGHCHLRRLRLAGPLSRFLARHSRDQSLPIDVGTPLQPPLRNRL